MGFLSKGDTLRWEDAWSYADYIREHGIRQFLNILRTYQSREGDPFLWGDEVLDHPCLSFSPHCAQIEYFIVVFDHEHRTVKLNLRANDILVELARREEENPCAPFALTFPS